METENQDVSYVIFLRHPEATINNGSYWHCQQWALPSKPLASSASCSVQHLRHLRTRYLTRVTGMRSRVNRSRNLVSNNPTSIMYLEVTPNGCTLHRLSGSTYRGFHFTCGPSGLFETFLVVWPELVIDIYSWV